MDRIERHDITNALALAAVILAMTLVLVWGTRSLLNTVGGDVVESSKISTTTTAPGDTADSSGTSVAAEAPDTTVAAVVHPPNEVLTRVGNGAQKAGVAGAGSTVLQTAGYQVLSGKNATPIDVSIVYYVDGYDGDAAQVARLLGIAETSIAPMPAEPPIPQEGAQVIAILGADTTVSGG